MYVYHAYAVTTMQLLQDIDQSLNRVRVPLTCTLGVSDLVKRTFTQAGQDYVPAFAASLTYRALFATFPFTVFLLSLLGIFQATNLVDELLNRVEFAVPPSVLEVIREQLQSIAKSQQVGAFRLGAAVSILAALWGMSSAFHSVMQAMNIMYKVEDHRPLWKQYLISMSMSLAAVALLISASVLVVFGPSIGGAIADSVGLGPIFQWTWNILQWPVLIGFVLLAFALVYYFAPDVKQEFRFITPGSVVAVALWLTFTLLFLAFVNIFNPFRKAYGALAGFATHMLFMYYVSYIVLLGAELNQIVEEHSPGGKQTGERTPDDESPPSVDSDVGR